MGRRGPPHSAVGAAAAIAGGTSADDGQPDLPGGGQLSRAQVAELEAVLEVGPAAWGWNEGQCSTLSRIAEVVARRFRVECAGPGPAGGGAGRSGHRRVAGGYVARHRRTVAEQGAWLVFEDESGQGLRPPRGRTWGRRGRTPVVSVTGGGNKRVSLAALIAVRHGSGPG